MLYAICENGGMVNEVIHGDRYESKYEAQKEALRLWYEELNSCEDEDKAVYFDVVGVDEDGNITTEI